jgi:hypothetical protein
VKNAVRTAAAEGLIEVRQGSRHITITVSATWEAWLDRHGTRPRTRHNG